MMQPAEAHTSASARDGDMVFWVPPTDFRVPTPISLRLYLHLLSDAVTKFLLPGNI